MMEADIKLYADYEQASAMLLTAIQRERQGIPNKQANYLMWFKEACNGKSHVIPRYEVSKETQRDQIIERMGLRVSRDPCGYCGTRRDLGCTHYPLVMA